MLSERTQTELLKRIDVELIIESAISEMNLGIVELIDTLNERQLLQFFEATL